MPDSSQKQHVDVHRKLAQRRELLAHALPGAAYVPYCGDGDIAAELYAGRLMIGCDTNPERIATIRERLPAGYWLEVEADTFWQSPDATWTQPVAIADFDAYAYPYDSFRDFWTHAPRARRVVMFFTDGERQVLKRALPGGWRDPDGNHHEQARAGSPERANYNFYWAGLVEPWIRRAVTPWRVIETRNYYREGQMLYWGCVVEAPADDNVADVGSIEAPPTPALPTPDEATPEDLGIDPLRRYKFDAYKRRLFLKRLAEGANRTGAAESVGINLRTVERALQEHAGRFAEMFAYAEVKANDQIEAALFMAARSGNVPAIAMWLYNRAPDRWVDRRRQDVQLTMGDEAIKQVIDVLIRAGVGPEMMQRIQGEFARLAEEGS